MITPLHARDELDLEGVERLVEHLVEGGVDGLFLLGTTGEGPSLSYALRRQLIQCVCGQVNRRLPVLVGVTDTSFVESVNLARYAAGVGADAVVVAAPFYMPPSQTEMIDYLERISAELPIPMFLYNFPALTKFEMQREVIIRSMQNPKILGLKDSSSDAAALRMALELRERYRPDWTLLDGQEDRLAEMVDLGANGAIPGGANVFPALYRSLYSAARAGETDACKKLQSLVLQLGQSLYRMDHGCTGVIKGIKCALRCMSICDDFMAEPFYRFTEGEHLRVRDELTRLAAAFEQAVAPACS